MAGNGSQGQSQQQQVTVKIITNTGNPAALKPIIAATLYGFKVALESVSGKVGVASSFQYYTVLILNLVWISLRWR